jgi:dTDP-4-dehydrorhamnose reductase
MAKVLVTGAKGMLGTDLCSIFQNKGHQVISTDIEEMDVRDFNLVQHIVKKMLPDWVIHLAALTDVDGCEKNPDETFLTNALGTQHVALACRDAGAVMVYVSTISVFDGLKCGPYTEFDLPNPKSYYSCSKYQGEVFVHRILDRSFIVRAGWMFGGSTRDKKFVAKIMDLAAKRDTLTVVNDKFGSPTYTCDLASGIERLIQTNLYGTYHMVNTGGYCSRYEFAQAILESAGITTCTLTPVSSAAFPLPAPRPRMEAARNYQGELRGWNWMRPWRDALREYITERLLPAVSVPKLEVKV